jgi:pyruvate,orthophosphate dikinase
VSVQIARIGGETAEQYPAEIVGGKAANLARMAALGLPVPPAFVLPISLCAATVNGEASAAQDLAAALAEGIQFLEKTTGKKFGDRRRPLLFPCDPAPRAPCRACSTRCSMSAVRCRPFMALCA